MSMLKSLPMSLRPLAASNDAMLQMLPVRHQKLRAVVGPTECRHDDDLTTPCQAVRPGPSTSVDAVLAVQEPDRHAASATLETLDLKRTANGVLLIMDGQTRPVYIGAALCLRIMPASTGCSQSSCISPQSLPTRNTSVPRQSGRPGAV